MIARKTPTGPLPGTTQIAQAERMVQPPLPDHVLQSAWMYLDDMRGAVSEQNMIDNVAIQYGLTLDQARDVFNDWKKVQA